MSLTKSQLQEVRNLINSKLEEVGEQTGMQIKLGNCSYNHSNATFKLEVATLSEDGEVNTKEAEAYKQYAQYNHTGLKPEWLFSNFTSDGDSYTLIGWKPRSSKYPALCKRADGNVYKLTKSSVIRAFERQTA